MDQDTNEKIELSGLQYPKGGGFLPEGGGFSLGGDQCQSTPPRRDAWEVMEDSESEDLASTLSGWIHSSVYPSEQWEHLSLLRNL